MSPTTLFQPGAALRGKRVLVTGATGFIGRWVAQHVNVCGGELWLAGRSADKLQKLVKAYQLHAEPIVADFMVTGSFRKIHELVRPHVTFNLAGYGVVASEQDEFFAEQLNSRLVQEMAETIASAPVQDWEGARLLHAGSAAEYGPVAGPVDETSATNPTSLYGKTKLAGTQSVSAAAAKGFRASCVRLFTVYGPGEPAGRLIPTLFRAAKSGQAVSLTSGTQVRDFTYVEDAAEGLIRLACVTQRVPRVVNLATGRMRSVREVILETADVLGIKHEQLQFGTEPAGSHDFSQGDVSTRLLKELTGWVPATSLQEGIRRMMELGAINSHKG